MAGISNLDELKRRILTSETLREKLQGFSNELRGVAASNTPVRTGRLQNSWGMEVRKGYNSFVGTTTWVISVDNAAYYAAYVEFGTRYLQPGRHMLQSSLTELGVQGVIPPYGGKVVNPAPRKSRKKRSRL